MRTYFLLKQFILIMGSLILFQFRVALLLGHHSDPVLSAQSVVISTLASGVPASPPALVRAVPIDSTRVSVSWEPGPFPHGPLLSYVLRITENHPQGYTALKVCHIYDLFSVITCTEKARTHCINSSAVSGMCFLHKKLFFSFWWGPCIYDSQYDVDT